MANVMFFPSVCSMKVVNRRSVAAYRSIAAIFKWIVEPCVDYIAGIGYGMFIKSNVLITYPLSDTACAIELFDIESTLLSWDKCWFYKGFYKDR